MGGLFAQDVEHGPWSEVELIEEEFVRIDDGDAERSQYVIGEVTDVGGDDCVGSSTDCRRDDVAIVGIREREGCFHGLPAGDEGVLEGVVHGLESLGDELGRQVGVDFCDGVGGLGKDPVGPQGPVQLALGESQDGVCDRDGYQDAHVEERRVPRQRLLACGAGPASSG